MSAQLFDPTGCPIGIDLPREDVPNVVGFTRIRHDVYEFEDTGILPAGQGGIFSYNAYINRRFPDFQTNAAAEGFIELAFAPVANPVPEPSTLAIWSLLGVLGIAFGWNRRRKAA